MFHPCWSSLHALPANTYFTWHLPMNTAYSQMHVLSIFFYFCSLLALSDSIEQVDRNYYVWPYSCTHIKRVRFGCVLCNNWMAIDWFIYRYWIMDVDVMMMYGCQYVFWTIQLLNHDVSFFFFLQLLNFFERSRTGLAQWTLVYNWFSRFSIVINTQEFCTQIS